MRPPFQVTGNPDADWIIFIGGIIVCLYWLRALRLAREGARLFLRNVLFALLIFGGLMCVFARLKLPATNAIVLSGFFALIAFVGRKKRTRRSRHYSKSVRKAVIARDLKGEAYDSTKHHIDHVWPFSKGGSHTTDNLRVISKEKNLKKGAKRPKMREMW